jgi:hypothetical protein
MLPRWACRTARRSPSRHSSLPSLLTGSRSSLGWRARIEGDHCQVEHSPCVSGAAALTACRKPIRTANDQDVLAAVASARVNGHLRWGWDPSKDEYTRFGASELVLSVNGPSRTRGQPGDRGDPATSVVLCPGCARERPRRSNQLASRAPKFEPPRHRMTHRRGVCGSGVRRLRRRHGAQHGVMIHSCRSVVKAAMIPISLLGYGFSPRDGIGARTAQGRRMDELAIYGSFIGDVRQFRTRLSGYSLTRAVHDRHRAPSVRRPCGGRTSGRGQLGAPDEKRLEPDRRRCRAAAARGVAGRGSNARGFPGAFRDPGRPPRTCRRGP